MPKSRPPYAAAFRQQMVELVQSGRTPGDLAREFEPSPRRYETGSRRLIATRASAPTACAPKNMRRFVGCAGRTGGCAKNAKFWQKPRPGSRGRPDPGGLPVHEHEPGSFSRRHDGPRARCLHERVLRVASTSTVSSCAGRCRADGPRAGDSCRQPGHVRRAADSRRTGRSRCRGRPQAGRAGDARGRHRWGEPAPRPPHDAPRGASAAGPDRVERCFEAEAPNRLWGGRYHLHSDLGRLPLLGHRSGRFQSAGGRWAMAAHLRTELVVEALEMAVAQRRPEAVIHHSDQGCQYTSLAFGPVAANQAWRCRWVRWGLLRQRDGGELLRDARVRAAGPHELFHARRGAGGGF